MKAYEWAWRSHLLLQLSDFQETKENVKRLPQTQAQKRASKFKHACLFGGSFGVASFLAIISRPSFMSSISLSN